MNGSILHSIITLKLGRAAFNSYDNDKDTLQSWRDLKQHQLERFKPSLSTDKTQLKECKKQSRESLITYYDDIIDLYKHVDKNMPLHMIVEYLQDGLRQELKIHAKCQLKILNDISTPAMLLNIARDEKELRNEFSVERQTTVSLLQPYLSRCVAATGKSSNICNTPTVSHTFLPRGIRNHRTWSSISHQQYSSCLVCNRSNHRPVDWHNKRPNSRYKCDDSNHYVRSCPQVFQ